MRSAATIAVALVLILLQSTLIEFMPIQMATPACGLLVVLHLGLSGGWTISSAALVAFSIGYLFDLVSGAPRGVHAFAYVVLVLFARAASVRLAVRGVILKAAIAFVASLVAALLVVVLRAQVSVETGYGGLSHAPFEALLTGVFAPLVLWLLARINGRLDPERARVGLARRRSRIIGSNLSR